MRRITGGLAILHDRDLTYSIIASTHDPLFSGGIKKTFYSIAQGLVTGLARFGVTALIHTPPPYDATSIEEDIRLGFETAWPMRFMRGDLTPQENQLADSLVTNQYNNTAWTEER
jgi:hypothetical protein